MILHNTIHDAKLKKGAAGFYQAALGILGVVVALCAYVGASQGIARAAVPCIQIEGGSTNYTDPTKPLNPNSPIAYHNAPICGTTMPYFGRGNRMPNVGVSVNPQGYAMQFNPDGSFKRAVCVIPERGCGAVGSGTTGAAGIAVAAGDEIGTPIGWVDTADCNTISGWALDTNDPNATISIHVYIDASAGRGGRLVGSAVANKSRPDLYGPFNTTADHGFSLATPDAFKDGKPHPLFIHAIDTSGNGTENLLIGASKKTIPACSSASPSGNAENGSSTSGAEAGAATNNSVTVLPGQDANLIGSFDVANCVQFTGWALDKSKPEAALNVNFYIDGPADGPADKRGKLMSDFAVTSLDRPDVNQAYAVTGKHGFVLRFASVIGNPLADGKTHQIYAYAISQDAAGRYAVLMNSPKSVPVCSGTSSSGAGGGAGGGGASGRHNYLSRCNGNGDFNDKEDPAIYAEVGTNGTITFTIALLKGQPIPEIKDADGKTVTPTVKENGDGTVTVTFTYKATTSHPAGTTVKVGNHTYIIDIDGVPQGGTVSVLVPVPCIRIGYNDELGGQNCEDGQSGTCAKELDAFINVDGIQNSGLHISVPPQSGKANNGDDFKVQYKVVGNQTNTGGWKDYDWRACGQYSNHCIRLRGQGVIYARTVLTDGMHFSLTTFKRFDADTGDTGLEDYDPL